MQFNDKIKLIKEFNGARINKEMVLRYEKNNKKEEEGIDNEKDWVSVKRENKFRIVFNDKIVKTIKNRFIKQIKKQKTEKIDEFRTKNEKLEKYEKAPKGMTKKEYNNNIDKKKDIISIYYDKLIKSIEKMNNEEFIINYLNQEKDKNLKNLMSSTLNKDFSLEEAKTCIASKLEEEMEEAEKQNKKEEYNIDEDIKKFDLMLKERAERNNLYKIKDYVNKNMEIKNLFPYEQKKLRRNENDINEKNKINEIGNDNSVYNVLEKVKELNEKIKKLNGNNKLKEKESEIKVEMASENEEEMEIEN